MQQNGLTKIDVYSAPAQETFVANADDEARGAVNNPFGTHNGSPASSEKTNGPFAGDEALFSFDVYTSSRPSVEGRIRRLHLLVLLQQERVL